MGLASMDKSEIRAEMRAKRKNVSAEARKRAGQVISRKLNGRKDVGEILDTDGPVAVYLASSAEIDLEEFITFAVNALCTVVAPRWNGTNYELVEITTDQGDDSWSFSPQNFVEGPHGILEPKPGRVCPPKDVKLWLVPGLAFTKDGKRIGYGGGWYDRLLADANPKALKLGIAYDFQVVDDLPVEAHDCRLSGVVDDSLKHQDINVAKTNGETRISVKHGFRKGQTLEIALRGNHGVKQLKLLDCPIEKRRPFRWEPYTTIASRVGLGFFSTNYKVAVCDRFILIHLLDTRDLELAIILRLLLENEQYWSNYSEEEAARARDEGLRDLPRGMTLEQNETGYGTVTVQPRSLSPVNLCDWLIIVGLLLKLAGLLLKLAGRFGGIFLSVVLPVLTGLIALYVLFRFCWTLFATFSLTLSAEGAEYRRGIGPFVLTRKFNFDKDTPFDILMEESTFAIHRTFTILPENGELIRLFPDLPARFYLPLQLFAERFQAARARFGALIHTQGRRI